MWVPLILHIFLHFFFYITLRTLCCHPCTYHLFHENAIKCAPHQIWLITKMWNRFIIRYATLITMKWTQLFFMNSICELKRSDRDQESVCLCQTKNNIMMENAEQAEDGNVWMGAKGNKSAQKVAIMLNYYEILYSARIIMRIFSICSIILLT